jgi:hypothetical protein
MRERRLPGEKKGFSSKSHHVLWMREEEWKHCRATTVKGWQEARLPPRKGDLGDKYHLDFPLLGKYRNDS